MAMSAERLSPALAFALAVTTCGLQFVFSLETGGEGLMRFRPARGDLRIYFLLQELNSFLHS
jgi:hypothetical protein